MSVGIFRKFEKFRNLGKTPIPKLPPDFTTQDAYRETIPGDGPGIRSGSAPCSLG
jgi:hypothetical protein